MSSDLILIIDHRETCVRMHAGALRVERPDSPPEHIPLGVLGLVIVHGSPLVGCEVWRELAERNIPAVLQPARGRGQSALVGSVLGNTIELRAAQHRASADSEMTLTIARDQVAGKVAAQQRVLERLDPQGDAAQELVKQHAASLERLQKTCSNAEIMGVEGAGANAWYAWLGGWLPAHWRFAGRNRRPPRDPVNALLSLGYTLLGGEMLRAVQAKGADPALGFLHGMVPGRESLVLDLIEPLRPSVDLVVLAMLDDLIVPTHFAYSERDGCRLNKNGRGLFYRAWANARADWPNLHKDVEAQPGDPASDLPSLCRRRVECLRERLRPFLPREHNHG